MTIAQLPADPGRARILRLVDQIGDDRLDTLEAVLTDMVGERPVDTRSLTVSELAVLQRFGVEEKDLHAPSSRRAIVRGQVAEHQMMEDSYSVTQAAELLGVTPARVRQRCAAGTLLAQRRSDGWYLPRFQFPGGSEPNGWSTVAAAIPTGTSFFLVNRILTSASPRLTVQGEELPPLVWLSQGGDPKLAAAAVDEELNWLP